MVENERNRQTLSANGMSADTSLRQSEERFRLLVESVQDYAIFLLDPEGYVSSWNMGARRIKGYADDASRTKAGESVRTARVSGPTS